MSIRTIKKRTKTRVTSYKYFSQHGRLPEGRGRWAFHPDFTVDLNSPEVFRVVGTFEQSKRKAIAHFSGRAAYVEVLS